jgi:hypothetical protein
MLEGVPSDKGWTSDNLINTHRRRREICAELTLLPRKSWLSYLGCLITSTAEDGGSGCGLGTSGSVTGGRWFARLVHEGAIFLSFLLICLRWSFGQRLGQCLKSQTITITIA